MAQNSFIVNIGLTFIVIYILANLRLSTYIKVILIPIFSTVAGLLSCFLYQPEPGSFAVFISATITITFFVSCFYPITRKAFQSRKYKADVEKKLVGLNLEDETKTLDNDDVLWEKIADEYDSDKRIKGLYAKLFSENNGDEIKIKSIYYKTRFAELSNGVSKE